MGRGTLGWPCLHELRGGGERSRGGEVGFFCVDRIEVSYLTLRIALSCWLKLEQLPLRYCSTRLLHVARCPVLDEGRAECGPVPRLNACHHALLPSTRRFKELSHSA